MKRGSVFAVVLVLVAVVAVFAAASRAKTTRLHTVRGVVTTVAPQEPMSLADLPEILPIGGAVVPATLATRSVGEILAGDVIVIADDKQARGMVELPAGEVILYRRGEKLKFILNEAADIGGKLVMRMFACREYSDDTKVGDVIIGFDGKKFKSEKNFVSRALSANSIMFIRDGVRLSRASSRVTTGRIRTVGYGGGYSRGYGGGRLQEGGFGLDCTPYTRGFCSSGLCSADSQEGQHCPCGYCGFTQGCRSGCCCQVYA